jgi:hypothetical protein
VENHKATCDDLQDRHTSQIQIRFANETPKQQAQHREIERRHRHRQQRQQHGPKLSNFRKKELEMVFTQRYRSWQLPNDDAGRADLRIMLDHLALRGEDHARRWAELRAPWMPEAELDDMIDDVGEGKFWTPAALGKALNLTNAERMRLDIRTIRPVDRTKKQLEQDCRERHAKAEAARRAKAGAKPQATSAERTKPWKAEGISRATWFRRKRSETAETD